MDNPRKQAAPLSQRAQLLQACPTLCHPVDCSPPGASAPGILQARILVWVAMPSSTDLSDTGIKPAPPASPARATLSLSPITWKAPLSEHHSRNVLSLGKSRKQSGLKFPFDVVFIRYFALTMKRHTITVECLSKRWAEIACLSTL